jgi:hypothetical protein
MLFCTILLVAPEQSLFAVLRVAFDLISAPFGLSCRHNSALSSCALGTFPNIRPARISAGGGTQSVSTIGGFGIWCGPLPVYHLRLVHKASSVLQPEKESRARFCTSPQGWVGARSAACNDLLLGDENLPDD